jgi:hypothetical protein
VDKDGPSVDECFRLAPLANQIVSRRASRQHVMGRGWT